MSKENDYYNYEQVTIEIKDFQSDGYILDIGGGGEGVIGKLKGKDVVAIDIRKEELEESAKGPLKIVMDATDLKFLENSFNTVTAFFSFMYIQQKESQQKIMEEVSRVLISGGTFHVWDVNLKEMPETEKEIYVVFIRYIVGNEEFGTGYGNRFPVDPRGEEYYISMAERAGLKHVLTEHNSHTFHMIFQKD